MISDYDNDTHFCFKCHATILGLDNYVSHRKSACNKAIVVPDPSKSPLPSQLLPPDEIGLKADDFFSSLELRSSSKKPVPSTSGKNFSGILTRSKTSAVKEAAESSKDQQEPQQSKSGKNVWLGGNQIKDLGTGDNQSKLIKAVADLERRKDGTSSLSPSRIGNVYEESDDDSEEFDFEEDESSEEDCAPPRNYTGGKWKPSSPIQWTNRGAEKEWTVPPPSFTGGKWKPRRPVSPPPSYTKGKWKPSSTEDDCPPSGGKYPPPGHTKGKWKPSVKNDQEDEYPPPSHTKGKWKPKTENDDESFPPPTHTKGKWKPKPDGESSAPSPTYTKGKWRPKVENNENLLALTDTKVKVKAKPDNVADTIPTKLKQKASTNMSGSDNSYKSSTKSKSKRSDQQGSKRSTAASSSSKASKPARSKLNTKQSSETDLSLASSSTSSIRSKNARINSPLRKSGGSIQYWCSTCNRSLASKIVFERHLKSDLHFKRSRPEREFDDGAMIKRIKVEENPVAEPKVETHNEPEPAIRPEKRRKRRKIYEICAVCHSKVHKYMMGKHLISHYHCRKGDTTSDAAKKMVLENIHSIVPECPFQCGVCRFYCNTHDDFLNHWKSELHKTKESGHQGFFLCAYCKHRDETSEDMLEHLVSEEHMEVVSVINRSVPIVIKKISQLTCLTCQEKFLLNIQLLNHCRKSGHDSSNVCVFEKDSLECKQCNKVFLSALAIQRHMRKKHRYKYFFCSYCDMRFETREESKKHRTSAKHRYARLEMTKPKGESLRRKCEYCEEYYPNFLLLKNHLKEKHPDHKVRCFYCGATFTVAQELSNHLRSKSCKFTEKQEDSENQHRCEKCPFTSDSTAELLYHLALHEGPLLLIQAPDSDENASTSKSVEKYKCSICDRFFPKNSLLPHLRTHTKERPYSCERCEATFTRKNNLLNHRKNHIRKYNRPKKGPQELKPFLCSTCGAGFRKKFVLQQHMLIHTGKMCRCPVIGCFYTARKMSELNQHVQSHSEEKNFACDLCEFKTKTKKQLKRHLTIHEPTMRHHCTVCSFKTRTSAHLKRHVRLHTGAKPYNCPHCDYKSKNLENLRRHILSTTKHPGKSVYECKFCTSAPQYETNSAKDFKNHLILLHNEVFVDTNEALSYVAGIYEAEEDQQYMIDMESLDQGENADRIIPKSDTSRNILKLKTNEDPVVAQLVQPADVASKDSTLDQMLPMFIIPKDDGGNVEIANDSWNLIGRYDVEESGALVPFHSEEEEGLFQEHF